MNLKSQIGLRPLLEAFLPKTKNELRGKAGAVPIGPDSVGHNTMPARAMGARMMASRMVAGRAMGAHIVPPLAIVLSIPAYRPPCPSPRYRPRP